jgi:glucose/arabinose dehydrogenase
MGDFMTANYMNKKYAALPLRLLGVFLFIWSWSEQSVCDGAAPSSARQDVEVRPAEGQPKSETIFENLNIPWEIVFLSDRTALVTERTGILKITGRPIREIPIEGVEHRGEGGLLGLALHPRFSENKWIYLYFTSRDERGLKNQVARYVFEKNRLSDKKIIIDRIPGAAVHNGGRIKFGPDGLLYAGTGDAGDGHSAQDTKSLAGKILRVRDDGSLPSDNPFGNPVFSYGHRNVQGLAWDDRGRLWATEHGRSGILSGYDELNWIEKGKNYGWPVIQGDETKEGMVAPVIHSGPNATWAPSGALHHQGSIFFAGLRGQTLYQARLDPAGGVEKLSGYFKGMFGRLRTVALGPDGLFYLLTSNTDGRGRPVKGDDRIVTIDSQGLSKP